MLKGDWIEEYPYKWQHGRKSTHLLMWQEIYREFRWYMVSFCLPALIWWNGACRGTSSLWLIQNSSEGKRKKSWSIEEQQNRTITVMCILFQNWTATCASGNCLKMAIWSTWFNSSLEVWERVVSKVQMSKNQNISINMGGLKDWEMLLSICEGVVKVVSFVSRTLELMKPWHYFLKEWLIDYCWAITHN